MNGNHVASRFGCWCVPFIGDFDRSAGRVMKQLIFVLVLAALPTARGGEIEAFYWAQQKTNQAISTNVVLSPRFLSTDHGITEIGIERTTCFGSCPAYVCTVRSDGTVRYHGEKHVERLGDWEANIDPYKFHSLANFIARSDYAKMGETFDRGGYDAETVYTTFVLKERRKVFRDYCSSGPPHLWALEQLIDGLVAGANWRPAATSSQK